MQIANVSELSSWTCTSLGCKIVAATLATGVVATGIFAYRRIYADSALPFENWKNLVGLKVSKPLSADELKGGASLPPQEFVERCFASLRQTVIAPLPKDKEKWSEVEWFDFLCNPNSDLGDVHDNLPSFQESPPLTIEDESAARIQSWAMSLQPFFALIRERTTPWKEVHIPIQTSPRLAFTILFNCLAPIAAKWMWDGAYDFLPASIQHTGQLVYTHKRKVAITCLGLILWLYYRMNQESGILTNVTENFARMHKTHRAIDRVNAYHKPIRELLRCVGRHEKGEPFSNILWYYNEHTHSTFARDICDILGEFTATGRIFDKTFSESKFLEEFSQLKDLQILKLNLRLFLTEYRTVDEVYRGWNETLNQLKKNPNTLVVLTGLSSVLDHLLPGKHQLKVEEPGTQITNFVRPDNNLKIILAELVFQALQQGKFRCLMEVTEETKKRMETDPELFRLFTPIVSPDLSPEEIEQLCKDLYTRNDQVHAFSPEEINVLFEHLKPVLSVIPHAPATILEVVEESLRDFARQPPPSPSLSGTALDQHQDFRKAERNLAEAHRIYNLILQKIWKKRINSRDVPREFKKALLMMKHIILPTYFLAAKNLAKTSSRVNLVHKMQKRTSRLYGSCTQQEEDKLLKLKPKIERFIKGQGNALNIICAAVHKWRKIPHDDGKPLVLFFAGSSGVGKSETATQLAYNLNKIYGINQSTSRSYESNVIRINLNRETQGGEQGWDFIKNNIILRQLLSVPTSTIIFEEWDKMSANEKSSLLELLDGTKIYHQDPVSLTKRFVDKSCVTIILTSNVETGQDPEKSVDVVRHGILQCFSQDNLKGGEAFLSRLDAIVPFEKLDGDTRILLIRATLNKYVKEGHLDNSSRHTLEEMIEKKSKSTTDARQLMRDIRNVVFSKCIKKKSLSRTQETSKLAPWLKASIETDETTLISLPNNNDDG